MSGRGLAGKRVNKKVSVARGTCRVDGRCAGGLLVADGAVSVQAGHHFVGAEGEFFFHIRHKIDADADEALMACNTKNINMVLAGVNLSSDGGLKAIESIRAYSAVLPIVAVLPSNSKSQVEDAMTAGANDYLVKPVNRDDLLAMCRKHLSGFPAFTSKLQGK